MRYSVTVTDGEKILLSERFEKSGKNVNKNEQNKWNNQKKITSP